LLSQITGNSNVKLAIDGGANEFLSKPFDYQELRSRVYSAARLVQYEIKLAEENKKLSNNLALIKDLTSHILALGKEIAELQEGSAHLDPVSQEKIAELQKNIDLAVKIVRNLQA
jgi:response regulator RpfG family c-di-GMP phosphodiesterase